MDILPHEKQIYEYIKTIEHLKKQNVSNPLFTSEINKFEQKLDSLKRKVYSELTPWQKVTISRHTARPHSLDYIKNICSYYQELCGDRLFADDQAVIGGLAKIGDMKCIIIGQEKGSDTDSRIHHNFGMMNPEGFRKAMRLMKLAEKFNLPVISMLDAAGANPGLEAEERGQGWAIAHNLREMASLKTPIIVVIIGEACSGGALGIGVGDVVLMLEHAYYSVISPEGCASILWKDAAKKAEATESLKVTADSMLELNIVDAIIKEPLGGAHHDPKLAYDNVKHHILEQWGILKMLPIPILLEQRYQKFRSMGQMQPS